MSLDDIINAANQQYETVDSKEPIKEEKVNMEEVLEANKVTEKWLQEEREYRENVKNKNFSKDAFTHRYEKSKEEKSRNEREERTDNKRSSSYGYNSNQSSSYGWQSSNKSSNSRTPIEDFFDKNRKLFHTQVTELVEGVTSRTLNEIDTEGMEWDILDMQFELSRQRLTKRDYFELPEMTSFTKEVDKLSKRISNKLDIAELILLCKVRIYEREDK